MQKVVVNKDWDIFDYVVNFAIKQHSQPEDGFSYSEYWNIDKNQYIIKFCGANGKAYRCFKFKGGVDKSYVQVLIWKRKEDNAEVEMSITHYRQKKKRKSLFVNYIIVNGEQVYKCKQYALESGRYFFEY